MPGQLPRSLSIDDVWSVLGYASLLVVNSMRTPPLDLAIISLLASGTIAILWLLNGRLRARNTDRGSNIRIAIWATIAVVSGGLAAAG